VRRGRLFSIIWATVLAFFCQPAIGAPAETLEYAVKATFIYKFPGFVEWPATSFESASSPVAICVLGDDPVAGLIDQVAAGQQVGDRAIAVKHLQTFDRDSGCQILYVAAGTAATGAINAARDEPVLTITDSASPEATGTIVTFVVEDNRVRFDINDAAAAQSGLTISSKLLSLARAVRTRP
jgi:hypothetical protein